MGNDQFDQLTIALLGGQKRFARCSAGGFAWTYLFLPTSYLIEENYHVKRHTDLTSLDNDIALRH